jgi:thymidylate synthase (FAD)
MPIWMAREWFRHTIGFARNEVSRRYVDDEPTFHIPEFRTRAPGKKQGSNDDVHVQNAQFEEFLMSQCRNAVTSYKIMLQNNIPPEQARMVLPQNMMTEFIETGSIAAYARLCHLRLGPDAQKEIRIVAGQVAEQLKSKFPVSWSALTPTPSESLSSAYKPSPILSHSETGSAPAPSEHIPDVQKPQ